MKTSEDTLAKDEIITESGRVFRPGNKEFLDTLPPDIVQEMARRRLKEMQAADYELPEKTTSNTGQP
jgi:hypothetical protein